MPQINITVSKRIDDKVKNDLQREIGKNMETLPGKNIGNTVICICDGCSMYKNGELIDGAFVDIRLFKASPEESKKEFAENLFVIFKTIFDVEPSLIYMNFIELQHWASNGQYS